MSTQETPVIDKPAVSSEAPKEKDVALFTEDKPTPTPAPATEETKPTPETEGEKPTVESPAPGTETPKETGTDPAPEGDKTPEPEKEVQYDLKLAEGSKLGQKDIDSVTAFAKENNLSNEAAQKLLDSKASQYAEFQQGQQEFLRTQQTRWLEETKADKEIGGDKFDQSIALAKLPIAKYASPGLRKMLDDSGLGNHPEVIKMFARIGKTMQPDTVVDAPKNQAASIEKPAYEYLYGEDKK